MIEQSTNQFAHAPCQEAVWHPLDDSPAATYLGRGPRNRSRAGDLGIGGALEQVGDENRTPDQAQCEAGHQFDGHGGDALWVGLLAMFVSTFAPDRLVRITSTRLASADD